MSRFAAAVAVLVLVAAPLWGASYLVGKVHFHTSEEWDDGIQTLSEALDPGFDFYVYTPHLERVGADRIERLAEKVRALTNPVLSSDGFVTVYDTRVASPLILLAPESGLIAKRADEPINRKSHMYGICTQALVEGDSTLVTLARMIASGGARTESGARGTLTNFVELIHRLGGVTVAAHPTNRVNLMADDMLAECDGMEVMYTGGLPGDEAEKMALFAEPPLAVPGQDDHGEKTEKPEGLAPSSAKGAHVVAPGSLAYIPDSERCTILLTEDRSPEGVVQAFRERREYAAFGPGRIASGQEVLGRGMDPARPFRMTFSGVKGVMAWIVWHSNNGAGGTKEVMMRGDTIRIDNPREWLPSEMMAGGWISVWAPAITPLIITAGIPVPPYELPTQQPQVAREPQGPKFADKLLGALGAAVLGGTVEMGNLRMNFGGAGSSRDPIPPPQGGADQPAGAPQAMPPGSIVFEGVNQYQDVTLSGRLVFHEPTDRGQLSVSVGGWNRSFNLVLPEVTERHWKWELKQRFVGAFVMKGERQGILEMSLESRLPYRDWYQNGKFVLTLWYLNDPGGGNVPEIARNGVMHVLMIPQR